MNAHERAVALVLEVLCAACVVSAVIAAAQWQAWWALCFTACAFGCYESAPEL